MVLQTFEEHDWIQNFKMQPATFCYKAQGHCNAESNRCGEEGCDYFVVFSHSLRVPYHWPFVRSTVCIIVHSTVNAIVSVLLQKYIL